MEDRIAIKEYLIRALFAAWFMAQQVTPEDIYYKPSFLPNRPTSRPGLAKLPSIESASVYLPKTTYAPARANEKSYKRSLPNYKYGVDALPPIYPPKTLPPSYPPQPYEPPYPGKPYEPPKPYDSSKPYAVPKSWDPPGYKKPHQGPKQNCTVKDEILRAEICTPSFETLCEEESMTIKKITTKEYCFDLATTECTETEETIENEVCVYEYTAKDEETTAKSVKVNFSKDCNTQKVSICEDQYGYHTSYGGGYCKEVHQTTCFNTPKVDPNDVPVTLSFPVPEKKCESKPIIIPRVRCEVKTEKKCVDVPDVIDDIQLVEKCQPVIGSPVCQKVELVLPKQVCQDILVGYAHKPSIYEH